MNKDIRKIIIMAIMMAVIVLTCVGCGSSGSGGTSKCTICGKSASHTFQGSGYCDKHYNDAVNWAMDHTKN